MKGFKLGLVLILSQVTLKLLFLCSKLKQLIIEKWNIAYSELFRVFVSFCYFFFFNDKSDK